MSGEWKHSSDRRSICEADRIRKLGRRRRRFSPPRVREGYTLLHGRGGGSVTESSEVPPKGAPRQEEEEEEKRNGGCH